MAEPKIKYDIEAAVTGQAGVKSLEKTLRELGGVLEGELRQKALTAADALQSLAGKQQAIDNFKALNTEVRKVGMELAAATRTVETNGAALDQAKASTSGFAQAQRAVGAAVTAAKADLQQTRTELQELRSNYSGAERSTDAYRSASQQLGETLKAQRSSLQAKRAELKASEAATKTAETAENKLSAEYAKAGQSAKKLSAEVGDKARALDASRSALKAAGIETTGLARAEKALQQSVAAVTAEIKNMAPALNAAGAAMQGAFQTIGVRSAAEIRAEITKVRAAMETVRASGTTTGAALKAAFDAGNSKIKALEREIRQVEGSLTLADRASAALKTGLGSITAGNLIADGISNLTSRAADLGREFIRANVKMQITRMSLDAIYKSSSITAAQIDFLRDTATGAGVSFTGLAQTFITFSAATKSANISLETSNALFSSVTTAAATLGLSSERTSLVLQALGQMASKGVVSMEELRSQLGESLPGALGLAAKGLGLTEAQLIKLVGSGKLATRDLFPALAESLKTMTSDAVTLVVSWERLKNAINQALTGLGDAGGVNAMTLALKALSLGAGAVVVPFTLIFEAVGSVARGIGILTGSIVTLTNPLQALRDDAAVVKNRLDDLGNSFLVAAGFADQSTTAQTKTAAALDSAGKAAAASAGGIDTATAATQSNIAAQDGVAVAQKIVADSTATLGQKWVQLGVQLGEVAEAQGNQVIVSEKLADATKIEGAALVALANLRGNDLDALNAALAAAENNMQALEKVAIARERQLASMQAELAQKQLLAASSESEALARKSELQELGQKAVAKQAEAIASRNAAEASKVESLAREIAVKTYRDNALAVGELRTALELAKQVEAAYADALQKGQPVKKEAEEATRRRVAAEVIFRDALADAIKLESARTSALQSALQVQQAGLGLMAAQATAAKEKAVRDGDEYAFVQASIKQKQIELQLAQLKVASLKGEAEGAIAVARATEAELASKGQLTEVQKISIANSIRAAEVKLKEAEIAGLNVTELKRQILEMQTGNGVQKEYNELKSKSADASNAHKSALDTETGALGNVTAAMKKQEEAMDRLMMKYTLSADYSERQLALIEKENALLEKREALEDKRLNRDKEKYSLNTGGKRIEAYGETELSLLNKLKAGGVDDAKAVELAAELKKQNDDLSRVNVRQPAAFGESGMGVVDERLQKIFLETAQQKVLARPTNEGRPSAPAAMPVSGPTRTINLNLNSQKFSVQTDAQGEAALEGFMSALENSKRNAGR